MILAVLPKPGFKCYIVHKSIMEVQLQYAEQAG